MTALRVVATLLMACSAQSSMALDWREPWVQPHDPQQAAANSDEYAWHLFVAINWPADPRSRAADSSVPLGADRPVVWESWQNASDVYLQDGRDPGPWITGRPQRSIASEQRFETFSLKDFPNARHIVQGKMVALVDPPASAKRLTEIRMNKTAFEYVRARELYSVDGQLRAVADGGVQFPAQATEVKAKWRPIRTDEQARYHTIKVKLADGTTRLYGLTGLHIVSKDLPQWFWATFEHVDNPGLQGSDGWQLPSSDHFACDSEPADCNIAPRGIGLEGTVWEHYRLRGTLTQLVDAAGRPLLLANSELEAGLQRTSSCIACHSRSSIGLVAGAPLRPPIFESPERHGYVGLAAQPGAPFQSLDFVWSLSKAQPKKVLQ
jgi:hypothetical protein